ncbi:MAG TPA: dipeptide epimerase [Ktedonobacterales bacterium]|nr:dipeptide epimerase [Ktedonobacterales bacterium]
MELTAQALDLNLSIPFRISRSVQTVAHNVLAQIEDDGLTGIGEAAPSGYYGEKCESVLVALSYFAEHLGDDATLIEDISANLKRVMRGNAAARAAVDMALYDLVGQRLGVPVYQLLGLNPERTPVTSFTIGLDTPSEMARKAQKAAQFPVLKIKVGAPDDLEIVRAIRDATDARLRVDANEAWTPKQAIKTINALEAYGVEFVEQPVAASDIEGLRLVREHTNLPIFADESCVTLEDVPRMAGVVDGINIKLMKCGGISQALKMIATARAHNLQVMLGCMIESSVAITAAAQISPLVDYADLDGALLTSNDPFEGVGVVRGKLVLPDRAGLGVRIRSTAKLPTKPIRARNARIVSAKDEE